MRVRLSVKVKEFKDYRETGFSKAIIEANKITIDMDIDLIFPQKCLIKMKKRMMRVQEAKMLHLHLKRIL